MITDLFSADWYLETYRDVAVAGVDPLQHYLKHGRFEGRFPCALEALQLDTSLWHAEDATIYLVQLEAILLQDEPLQSSLAAWVLSRWYGSLGQWQSVQKLISTMLKDNLALEVIRHQGPFLLAFTAYFKTSRIPEALKLLKHPGWADTNDKVLAESMLCNGEQKIATINSVFEAHGLSCLVLDSKPSLDNLYSVPNQMRYWSISQPLISVIVPCFNSQATISNALRSLLSQTHMRLEILVVDDASTDDSALLVSQLAERDGRVRLIKMATNQGAYVARNAALKEARGEFICAHDADDWSHPHKLERQLQALQANEHAMGCLSYWVRTCQDLHFQRWRMEDAWIYPNISSLMFRRCVFEVLGFWDRVSVNADTEYCYRIRQKFGSDSVIEALPGVPLSFGRADEGSLTQTEVSHLRTQFRGLRKDYHDAAVAWQQQADILYVEEEPEFRPFAVPAVMCRGAHAQQLHNLYLLLESSCLFDKNWYLNCYPDVAESKSDPLWHFLHHGLGEGRDIGPDFSFSGYCYQQKMQPSIETLRRLLSSEHSYDSLFCDGDLIWQAQQNVIVCVAHLVSANQFGAERSLLDVLDAMIKTNNIVVVLPSARNVDYVDAVRARCHHLVILPYEWWRAGRSVNPRVLDRFSRIIAKFKPDLLYVNTLVLWEPLLAAKLTDTPSVVHVRELPEHDADLCEILCASPEEIRQHVLISAPWFIANSNHVAKYLQAPERCCVIDNCVDVDEFPYLPLPQLSRLQVALLSSNLPKKGLYDVIALATLCLEQNIHADFLLYGPQNTFTQSLKQQGLPSNVHFFDYVERPQEAIAKADIVLNVSHFQESFGRSVLEAMASGRPVLCYDWGALADWVKPEYGILVPFGDLQALAKSLAELYQQPSRLIDMGLAARNYADTEFGSKRFAIKLTEWLNTIKK